MLFDHTRHQRPCVRWWPTVSLLFLPASLLPWGRSTQPPRAPHRPCGRIQKATPRSSHCHSPARRHAANMPRAKGDLTHLFEGFLYLHQGVPVRDGLPRVRQHLVPVVPAQAFGVDPHTADTYDLVVAHSAAGTEGAASGTAPAPRKGALGAWDSALRAPLRPLSSENRQRGRRRPWQCHWAQPASVGRHGTQTGDEQKARTSFGVWGSGGQMARPWRGGAWKSLSFLDSARTSPHRGHISIWKQIILLPAPLCHTPSGWAGDWLTQRAHPSSLGAHQAPTMLTKHLLCPKKPWMET